VSTPGSVHQDASFGQRMQRIETLVQEMEALDNPVARAGAVELVQAILELHGTGLERILASIQQAGEPGRAIMEQLLHDDLVGSLLLLHDLHPLDPETRIRRVLESLHPHLGVQGGRAELVGFAGGIARLRIESSGHNGHGASATSHEETVRRAVLAAAPEAIEVVFERTQNGRAGAFIPLTAVHSISSMSELVPLGGRNEEPAAAGAASDTAPSVRTASGNGPASDSAPAVGPVSEIRPASGEHAHV